MASGGRTIMNKDFLQLRKERGGLLAAFTRCENNIIHLLDSKEVSQGEIGNELLTAETVYDKLLEKTDQLSEFVGDNVEEKESLRMYVKEVYDRLQRLKTHISKWVMRKPTTSSSVADTNADVRPEDSVSQIGSKASTTTSSLAARKAALQVCAAALEKKHQIKIKQLELHQMEEKLAIETELAVVEAEEKVCDYVTVSEVDKSISETKVHGEHGEHNTHSDSVGHEKKSQIGETQQKPSYSHDSFHMGTTSIRSDDIADLLHVMQLPKVEIMTFDGDPLKYWTFIRTFDSGIGSTKATDSGKLNCLLQYCSGIALEVIECCAIMEPSAGYQEARRLLQERFGNKHVIAKAWLEKIAEGPSVKNFDSAALRRYADSVRSAIVTMTAMGRLCEIDNQIRMKSIVEKLPPYLQNRWRKKAVDYLRTYDVYPDINQLADFIIDAAAEADDPVFGMGKETRATNKPNVTTPTRKKGNVSSFSVQTEKDRPHFARSDSCKYCGSKHLLFQCEQFQKQDLAGRLEFVKGKRLCFNCFSPMHMSYSCPRPSKCNRNGCVRKHSSLLHDNTRSLVNSPHSQVNDQTSCTTPKLIEASQQSATFQLPSTTCGASGASQTHIALPIVPVVIKVPNRQSLKTYALLDPGSTNTFCAKELADSLGMNGTKATLSLNTITSNAEKFSTRKITLDIADLSERQLVKMSNVIVVDQLPSVEGNMVSQDDIAQWPHLRSLPLPDLKNAHVSILIGQDNPQLLIPLEVSSGGKNEPYATRTMLGWAINGPVRSPLTVTEAGLNSHFIQVEDDDLQSLVKTFWEIENSETLDDRLQMSIDDQYVVDLWNRSVQMEQGHYKLPIPFKNKEPNLPNNYCLADSRLDHLGRKLMKNNDMHERYKAGIQELLDKGFAEKVPANHITETSGPVWYIPHHVVLSEKKPDKFRIVFDCSAKFRDVSLNTEVLQGPDLSNGLIGVLLRFRQGSVAIAGDIEHMFLQVKVSDEHRDALRFLWWEGGDPQMPVEVYRMTSHLFGGVWSSSVANYAVKKTAKDNAADYDALTVQTIEDDFYVDDVLASVSSEETAISLVHEISEALGKGGFKLKKWISNSRMVLKSVPVEDRAKDIRNVDLDTSVLPQERALGVCWNTERDELGFKCKLKNKPFTRRGLISVISSVYDPIGFISPVILQAKKIFQEECRLGKGWDSPLEKVNVEKWLTWLDKLCCIECFSVPRCIIPQDFGEAHSIQVHHFADASQDGCGVVLYCRMVNGDGVIHCSFLLSKSRLAPIKKMTIPRLELSAALLAVKVNNMLLRELRMEIQSTMFWTDSMIVLHYIKNDTHRYQTFVANRISQIRAGSSPENWKYVPSEINPADDASRGISTDVLVERKVWIHGPEFLYQSSESWPEQPEALTVANEKLEIRKVRVNVVKIDPATTETCTHRLMQRYSSWYKLKKTVAWILRLKSCLLQKIRGTARLPKNAMEHLSSSEMKAAEMEIIRYIQQVEFPEEIASLTHGGLVKHSSSLYSLEPFLNNDGVLCVGGRLSNAPIPETAKHQMIMPKNHHVVTLIIRQYHESLGHSGVEHVLASVRQQFWIINCRRAIKKVLRECTQCKRLFSPRLCQRMAELPEERVTLCGSPFTHVSVDCFGPFLVKRGRAKVKRYGCLFTCLTTRAIHLEMLDTMETNSFINALRRFEARRGKPTSIRSDNGSNFKGAAKELQQQIKQWNMGQIQDYLLQRDIDWKFNPPTASHMGGIWERQIRTVRKVLY